MKPTINQIAACGLAVILIACLCFKKDLTADVKQAFIGGLSLVLAYLFASNVGSHAKDAANADTLDKAVNNLANSTPNPTKNS